MAIEHALGRDKVRRYIPLLMVLAIAIGVELRSASDRPEQQASTVQAFMPTIDPALRRLALPSGWVSAPHLTPGDIVDLYSTDPLTGAVELVGTALVVVGNSDAALVVAAPQQTIVAVAARGAYGHVTVVGY